MLFRSVSQSRYIDIPTPAKDAVKAKLLEVPGGGLVVTLVLVTDGGLMPIVTLGVAPTANARLWQMLAGAAKKKAQEPAAPWLAVIPYPGLNQGPYIAGWLADLERCLAWAWIDQHG